MPVIINLDTFTGTGNILAHTSDSGDTWATDAYHPDELVCQNPGVCVDTTVITDGPAAVMSSIGLSATNYYAEATFHFSTYADSAGDQVAIYFNIDGDHPNSTFDWNTHSPEYFSILKFEPYGGTGSVVGEMSSAFSGLSGGQPDDAGATSVDTAMFSTGSPHILRVEVTGLGASYRVQGFIDGILYQDSNDWPTWNVEGYVFPQPRVGLGVRNTTAASLLVTRFETGYLSSPHPRDIAIIGSSTLSAPVGTALGHLVVQVTDHVTSDPIPGALVTFTDPVTGASASLAGPTDTTDISGFASTNATANLVGGTYQITATVIDPQSPTITSPPPSGVLKGIAYSHTYTATGDPNIVFYVSAGALPTGLSLSSDGQLTGTATAAGVFTGTVTAANGITPDDTQAFDIGVDWVYATFQGSLQSQWTYTGEVGGVWYGRSNDSDQSADPTNEDWVVGGGQAIANPNGGLNGVMMFPHDAPTADDYFVEATFEMAGVGSNFVAFQLFARGTGRRLFTPTSHDYFYAEGDTNTGEEIGRWVNAGYGGGTEGTDTDPPEPIVTNGTHKMRLEVQGMDVSLYWDGTLYLTNSGHLTTLTSAGTSPGATAVGIDTGILTNPTDCVLTKYRVGPLPYHSG